jgi:hypothetical protein
VSITITNLLVFAVVVSHSCTTMANAEEPKPVPQITSSQLKDKPADELSYKAYLTSARAFANIEEKSKAIESYEKAILAAPNERCRKATIEELNSFSAGHRKKWFSDSFTLFLQKIQPNWIWVVLVFLLLPLYFSLRRFIRWLPLHKKFYRLLILPTSKSEFATHFCDLIQYTHDSFEEQHALVRQISRLSSRTIAPTFQSTNLIAELPLNPPDVFTSKWWAPFVNPIANKIDPPNYIAHLGVLDAEKQYSLTIRLCIKNKFLGHWHKSCDSVNVHCNLQDLAYQVVVSINRQGRKDHYDT